MKYVIFLAFTLLACKNIIPKQETPEISTEALDTIKSVPAKVNATPLLFETAFIKGTTKKVNTSIVNLYGVTIGKIKITSGHVVACDPALIAEYGIPFTQVFPKGEFPVQLAIGRLNGKESVAYARIYFSEEPVEKWQFALLEGQEAIPLGGEKKYGYVIDTGVGSFFDAEAKKGLDMNKVDQMDADLYQEMNKHYRNHWRYTMYDFGNYNLAAFSAGFGDGYYATYIGFDAKGKPCRLLTDFDLFDWSK